MDENKKNWDLLPDWVPQILVLYYLESGKVEVWEVYGNTVTNDVVYDRFRRSYTIVCDYRNARPGYETRRGNKKTLYLFNYFKHIS